MTQSAPFAFICYPRTVAGYVRFLADGLAEAGIDTWYDVDIPNGRRWDDEIAGKLATAGAVIVVMADDAGDHKWIRHEIDEAKALGKDILTVLLSGTRYPDLSHLQDCQVSAGVLPPPAWVEDLRAALRPSPPPPPWLRRLAIGGTAALAVAAVPFTAARLFDTPADDACGGRPARIVRVSEERPGHTGRNPYITVTVCRAAATGHSYWLMDYQETDDGRRFWAKTRIGGDVATEKPYPVVHSNLTEDGSRRTYVVVDVPPASVEAVESMAPGNSRFARPGEDSLEGMPNVSNGVEGVL
ncbi:toll/interleukin-1 receptor domain-containing protein [Virgisporangium aurantiacum]|uniref:toll/interleukin-1 receptor domain-containing protein n=1 Tax=Virgisporangium aurantiacum TaxID=175570 RepID=UPI001951A043|nr:toll/interleukin-1 receptor domain-containing protein [Virgisporangium aurantiacum]